MEEKLAVSLQEALQEGDTRALREVLEEIHPQDLLALWDELKGEHRYVVLTLLPKAKAAEVLSHLSPEEQAEYLKTLPPWRLREILEELSLDDLADALQAVRKEDPAYFQRLKEAPPPRTAPSSPRWRPWPGTRRTRRAAS